MSKFVDSIIGHAIGDAMGVPTEFCIRERLLEHPVTEMISSDKTGQPAGSWSDDTSMEICTIDSFIQKGKWDYSDIMSKWLEWINEAKYTANNETFDVGRTCLRAIRNFSLGTEPLKCGLDSEVSNGNGSLMRILPVALYSYFKKLNEKEIRDLTNDVSSLTHAHEISKLGCYIYVRYIMYLLDGKTKEEAYNLIQNLDYSSYSEYAISKYERILKNNIKELNINSISSGGYVVDTLECSLWVLLNANSYKETIVATTNIGNDTDTVGAIAGSMAGIIYGVNSIPEKWINKLKRKEYLIELSLNFEKAICSFKKDVLLGTIIGDVAGSRFEIVNNKNGKKFEMFHRTCRFTDDTVMTLAVAKALCDCNNDYNDIEEKSIKAMSELGKKYPKCGYGRKFYSWIISDNHEPYGSFGNGAAMRISPVGIVGKSNEEIKKISDIITNVSHNHPDSTTGAEAVCIAINMALKGKSKEEIISYIEENYFVIKDLRIDEMDTKIFHINCIETVKQSLDAFNRSYDFEDTIRNAVEIGGDTDTIAAIAGGIAAAYYGIPEQYCNKVLEFLDEYLIGIYNTFNKKYNYYNYCSLLQSNISKEIALDIANKELKNSYYKSKLKQGWIYGLLSFELECIETIYNSEEVYYISVIGGTFGAHRDHNHEGENNTLFSKLKNIDGVFDKDSEIKCVIYKKDGKYEYLGD